MTEAAEATQPEVRTATSVKTPPSWIKELIAEFSPAADLVADIIKNDPVHTPGTVRPDTIGLSEKWDTSAKGKDFVIFVDPKGRPALFVQPEDFAAFAAGKDVAKVARGVGSSPQEAWSDLFTKLAARGSAILVAGKPGHDRRYYTLEPFNEAAQLTRGNPMRCAYFMPESNTVRWARWTPPIDMDERFAPRPVMR